MKVEIVKITEEDLHKCFNFAVAQIETSKQHYKKRGQGCESKILKDITTGKLGEIAISRLLKSKGLDVDDPDFEIYESRNKSFDADLSIDGLNFHCKAQDRDSAAKYGTSWILQYDGFGNGHQDKLFKHRDKNDYLIPCTVYDNHVEIYGVIKIDTIFKKGFIKEPKVDWLKMTKRAIYLNDIKTLPWNQRWGLLNRN